MTNKKAMQQQAAELKLHGLLAHWHELSEDAYVWLQQLIDWERNERQQRSLERRLTNAKLGRFKSLNEFDWRWPDKIDQAAVQALMSLDFIKEKSNVILLGSNGVGKSTIAQNLGYQAVMAGHTALFTTASNLLNDLAAQDGDNALRRRFKHYARPKLLVIDEVG